MILYMSNEEFIQSLDNGVIYDHNFLMDKLEVDREEGNIEGTFQDVVQLFEKDNFKHGKNCRAGNGSLTGNVLCGLSRC